METSDLESGGTVIKLNASEGAVVWTADGHHIILPKQESYDETFVMFIMLSARLQGDAEFLAEMKEWFDSAKARV